MKGKIKQSLTLLAVAALGCAGCAKHEMVKQDQMIPAAQPAAKPAAPAVVKESKAAPKDDALAKSSINEGAAGQAKNDAGAQTGKDAALKSSLERVFFDFDSYTLSPEARATLAKNADILKKQANLKIRIEGNCDELGSDDYNLALGESRAKSAKNYLTSLGIKPERLSTISYGKEKPADPGHDDGARAKNRRDEFVVTAR